jgi:imidazolonepropionase-like amidohydrolase
MFGTKLPKKTGRLSEWNNHFHKESLFYAPQIKLTNMYLLRILLILIIPFATLAQLPVPTNGVAPSKGKCFALKNATILVSPTKTIEKGTLLIRDGKVIDAGAIVIIPADAIEIDFSGKTIVPSFIELYSSLGIPEAKPRTSGPYPQLETAKEGPYYWNEAIHPEIDPTDLYGLDEAAIDELHKMGFGAAVVHQQDGIARGTGTLVTLGKLSAKESLLKPKVASFYSFQPGASRQTYPSSEMGSIALLRQAFYDAEWQAQYGKTANYSLQALTEQAKMPSVFYTNDKYELLRVHKIAHEFKRTFTIMGTGREYELANIWDTFPHTVLIPLNFPEGYDLKDPYISRQIPIADLKHWELAPTNPARLMQQNAKFALTGYGTKQASDFWKNMHKALSKGWTVEDALRSLTVTPATLIGVDQEIGTLEAGKWACFSVFDENPFLYEAKLLETWTKGDRAVKVETIAADIRGAYSMNIDGTKYWMEIKGSVQKPEAKVSLPRTIKDSMTGVSKPDTLVADATILFSENDIVIHFLLNEKELTQPYSLKGIVNTRVWIFEGDGTNPSGKWIKWSAIRNKSNEEKDVLKKAWTLDTAKMGKPLYPNNAFGFDSVPKQQTIVIQNATLWTNESQGIVSNGTVVVENGKIKAIYAGSSTYSIPNGAKVIDAQGKHLTSGIIDEHSHIALSKGVNESGQSISAEVRLGDVIDADDINIYRQLSGGVTAAQLLHGSSNPVGGQSALVKLKWGHLPNDFLIPNATPFIKFALGENVKQANWGDFNTVRFPQTRMGVEQVYIDGFSRALAYHKAIETFETMSAKQREKTELLPPARDLELDALYEVVSGKRRITCHSYVQSEINMLMHVADSFGFNVNTFTHILEGYKVADKMKAHGAGASTFADWWAYKFEVKDAIPQNASLLNQMGVTVAINSDDAEMGRRLNQEAAKAVKYGGATEEEAWKMVTLNPAKLLQLDQRMGSIAVGKDADLVLWTTNPLSIESKVLYTIVDGEILFDSEADFNQQKEMEAERARIAAKMQEASKKGEPTKPFVKKRRGQYHCNTIGEEHTEGQNEH